MTEKEKTLLTNSLTKKIAVCAIFTAIGVVLSFINVFAYFTLLGYKINPYVHIINSLTGVLLGVIFSCISALGIASLRFAFSIGTIHAFHGGISGAFVVGSIAIVLKKKAQKYVNFAALFEPLGTVFIGGTIAYLIAPTGTIETLFFTYGLFALSSVPGCIIGFVLLEILRKAGINWEDFN